MATAVIKVGGNGYYQDWTRSDTGVSAYTLVDDGSTHDSNTTYIYSATAGHRSTFTLLSGDIPSADMAITGFTVYAARIYGAIKVTCRLSSTNVDSSSLPGAVRYGWVNGALSRPGGGSWTKDDLSSVEIGVVQDEDTTSTRVTSIYLLLTYDEISSGTDYPETVAVDNNAYFGGQTVGSKFGRVDAITNASYTLTGQTVGETVALNETVSQLAMTLTGQTIGSSYGRIGPVSHLTMSLVGQAIAGTFGRNDTVSYATLTYTGQNVGGVFGRIEPIDVLILSFTGQTVGSTLGRIDAVDVDVSTLTGQDVIGTFGTSDSVTPEMMTFVGQAVGSVFSSGSTSYSDIVKTLTLAFTGHGVASIFTPKQVGGGSHSAWRDTGYDWAAHEQRERLRKIQLDDDDMVAILTRFVTLEDR